MTHHFTALEAGLLGFTLATMFGQLVGAYYARKSRKAARQALADARAQREQIERESEHWRSIAPTTAHD